MAFIYDPIAREQLSELRSSLGALYLDAIWAQRVLEQQARNTETVGLWRQSFPAWDRLFGRPARNTPANTAAIIAMPRRETSHEQRCA